MPLTPKQLKQIREASFAEFGNRVHAAFLISEIPQTEFARESGLAVQYVNDVARGRYHTVTVDNAHKFAEFFGCAIEDLFPAREEVA